MAHLVTQLILQDATGYGELAGDLGGFQLREPLVSEGVRLALDAGLLELASLAPVTSGRSSPSGAIQRLVPPK